MLYRNHTSSTIKTWKKCYQLKHKHLKPKLVNLSNQRLFFVRTSFWRENGAVINILTEFFHGSFTKQFINNRSTRWETTRYAQLLITFMIQRLAYLVAGGGGNSAKSYHKIARFIKREKRKFYVGVRTKR